MAGPLRDYRWPLDEALFHAINGLGWSWLDAVWVVTTNKEFAFAVLGLLAAAFALKHRLAAVWAFLTVGLSIAVTDALGSQVLKPAFGRMRPSFALTPEQVRVLSPASNVGSMPSLHAANAFAVATCVAVAWPRAGWLLMPVALTISLSRVGVGVHWPTDLLAGALYGVAIGLPMGLLLRWLLASHPRWARRLDPPQ